MSASPATPMQRAQRFIRPKLKPKSPLRRKICLPNTSASHTDTRSPTSSNSSTSGHGHGSGGDGGSGSGNGMMRSYSTSSSAGTLSTSNSGSSLFGSSSSSKTADVQHVHLGDYSVSLPVLVTAGAALFSGGLVLRAIVTFSASLLRLFVLVVVVVAAVTFSQFREKQRKTQNEKAAFAAAQAASAEAATPTATTPSTMTATAHTTYLSTSDPNASAVIDVSAYRAHSGGNKAASTLLSSPYAGHNYGYGHAKYSSAPPVLPSSTIAPPAYSTDRRTRQLLSPPQRL